MTSRPLTAGERAIVQGMFGDAVDAERVRIHRRKWFFLHPAKVIMAPDGHIWVPPKSDLWADDYSKAPISLQGLFVHEMTHVWQAQRKGRWYLPLMRHPFCRYDYSFVPGWPLDRYGLEQQAEIMRHVFLQRRAVRPAGVTELASLEGALPFRSA
ncbi:vgr related protein [Sphingosinicella sp. LHD-64]|uniref:vgr related protein n=1 Tax=Sphingosinicella sp. LHD-64 TaxID=3072139 RepID=UPI00280FD1FD|nr:vgr related protein [Sphingosinicella sp. LHD-64]MDQ8756422.1 vgr related protein [Sphingosinicella sp. LHD-64]